MNISNNNVFQQILEVRIAQLLLNEEYKAGKFKIPIHLAFGHESISVAVSRIMRNDDKLILSHRNVAYNLARIRKLKPILDEYLLRPEGSNEGKIGSMNLINPELGIIYSSSILGNNFGVAVGIAMAERISLSSNVTIVLAGDGAIEEGSFHESLLMLKSLELSSLVIIENNEWSMSTRINERRHSIDLEKFSDSINVKYCRLSGNDPIDYIQKLDELRAESIEKNTPILIEVDVTTLGEWILKNEENPDGKKINYHAGPTPSVSLDDENVIINNTTSDPVHVISKMNDVDIQSLTKPILDRFRDEIK